MIRLRAALAAVLLFGTAVPAVAQLPGILPAGSAWRDIWYPKLYWTPRNGFTAGGHLAFELPTSYAHWSPSPHRVAFTLDGQASTSGSRFVTLDAFAPDAAQGWRFRLTLSAERWNRDNYYGVGNSSVRNDANVTSQQEFFYRARRLRSYVRGEIQRRIVGGLRALVGFDAERWRIESIDATPDQLRNDSAAGAVTDAGRPTNDIVARLGLVFDTRNDEVATTRGVLVEFIHDIADSGVMGGLTYTRTMGSVRGFLPVGMRWTLAARVVGQRMGGNPPLGTYYLVEASDEPYEGLGGTDSHRALPDHRYLGRDKLFANVDVRYALLPFPFPTTLVGFVDAGRVFQTETFHLTTAGMKVGGGAGLFLQIGRNGILGLTLAGGADGFLSQLHTSWTF